MLLSGLGYSTNEIPVAQGARLYLEISIWSVVVGQIGWTQLIDRLEALSSLSPKSDPARIHAERVLLLSLEEKSTDEWLYGQDEPTDADQSEKHSSFESDGRDGSDESDPYCYLIIATSSLEVTLSVKMAFSSI